MGAAEISKLAFSRGCSLNMSGQDDVLLYWIENTIFVSKPFEQLEELVDLILRLPICGQDTVQASETIVLAQTTFCPSVPLAA